MIIIIVVQTPKTPKPPTPSPRNAGEWSASSEGANRARERDMRRAYEIAALSEKQKAARGGSSLSAAAFCGAVVVVSWPRALSRTSLAVRYRSVGPRCLAASCLRVSAAGIELELLVGGDRLIDIGRERDREIETYIASDHYEPTDRSIDRALSISLSRRRSGVCCHAHTDLHTHTLVLLSLA